MDHSYLVFFASFVISGAAGLASLLRSEDNLTYRSVATAILNSSLLGLGISLLWYSRFTENHFFLVGICVLSGLGGLNTIDVVLRAFGKKMSDFLDNTKDNKP